MSFDDLLGQVVRDLRPVAQRLDVGRFQKLLPFVPQRLPDGILNPQLRKRMRCGGFHAEQFDDVVAGCTANDPSELVDLEREDGLLELRGGIQCRGQDEAHVAAARSGSRIFRVFLRHGGEVIPGAQAGVERPDLPFCGGGGDFATVAQEYSEDPRTASGGGDMGFIPASALDSTPQLKQAVLALQVNQFTGIIRSATGYHIIKLLGMEPAATHTLSELRVQNAIRQTLRNEREQLLKAAYIETLRNRAKVVNYLAEQIVKGELSPSSSK